MIVSWNWLKEYVKLDMPVETLTERLMMAGLNLEAVADVEGDMAIDLEVTSNRPDCLSHIGVAREHQADLVGPQRSKRSPVRGEILLAHQVHPGGARLRGVLDHQAIKPDVGQDGTRQGQGQAELKGATVSIGGTIQFSPA